MTKSLIKLLKYAKILFGKRGTMNTLNFEIPSYIKEDLEKYKNNIPLLQEDNLIVLVNLAKLNRRINEQQSKKLKRYIKKRVSNI